MTKKQGVDMGLPIYPKEGVSLADDILAADISNQPRKDWRKTLSDIKNGRKDPWEFNRSKTFIDTAFMDKGLAQQLDDAFQVAANSSPPPHLKNSKRAFRDPGAIEVETVEEKNRLIHLYHLLMKPPPLVYAGESVYGHFLKAMHDQTYLMPFSKDGQIRFREHVKNMLPQLLTLCPFVINHNWKAVLEKAGEAEGGDFFLPDSEATVFEFAMEGMRILALATEMADLQDIGLHLWVRLDKQWICLGAERLISQITQDETDVFYSEIRAQLRAACIVMESEVAERETVRADYKRNVKREKQGQHKFFDYHVVKLAHRHRLMKSDMGSANNDKRASPRLHFVRGHWRHFDNWKTKVKWHYRGDADLGFIDKEYRL